MSFYNSLNEKQKEAVLLTEGPVSVIAGPGTGKTRTLTSRFIHLVGEKKCSPTEILAVTFTNKAADEMKMRIIHELPEVNMISLFVMTFHSFGLNVIRRFGDDLDIPNLTCKASVIDEDDQKKIVNEIKKVLGFKGEKMNEILNYIEAKKTAQALEENILHMNPTYEKIYLKYQERLKKDNLVDFDDLLIYPYKLLLKPEILHYYETAFKYIMVDEFQDTSKLQFLMVKLLAQKKKNIFVVGDPDQSIYAFRGANYKNYQLFNEFFNPKKILLSQNYRSTKQILKHANSLIVNNSGREPLILFTQNSKNIEIIKRQFLRDRHEAKFVVDEINDLIARFNIEPKDIVILYRNNHLSRLYEEYLTLENIDYKVLSGHSFFEREEVKDIIAYLQLSLSNNNYAFKRIVNKPIRGIGPTTIEKVELIANDLQIDLFSAALRMSHGGLDSFTLLIHSLRDSLLTTKQLKDFFDEIIKQTNFIDHLTSNRDDPQERIQYLLELKSIIAYAETQEDHSLSMKEKLAIILDRLSLDTSIESSKAKNKTNAISLSSIHRVKGLEFNTVFMVALEQGILPSSNDDLDEERRVCYVGFTRAKERLYLTSAKERYVFGALRETKESQFIKEAISRQHEQPKNPIDNVMSINEIKVGDKRKHPEYGVGIVILVDQEKYKIAFNVPHGVKIFKRGTKEE